MTTNKNRKTFFQRLKEVGPGAMVAAAFIGPGTVTSCAASGANFGYALLWAMLLSVISVVIMQEMSARLGIVTGMGLSEALRAKYTGKTARIILAVLVLAAIFIGNVAYETGNITGSALGIKAIVPSLDTTQGTIILACVIGLLAFLLLFTGTYSVIEKVLTAMVVLMGVLFLACAIAIKPDWGAVLKNMFVPNSPDGSWLTIAALMGTTVVPYNIYLHASSAAKKWNNPEEDLATSKMDSILAIGLGGLISMAIIVCAAAAGFETAPKNGGEMAVMLKPILGNAATILFGLGLFAAGSTSALTAPLSAAFACSGILGWGSDMKNKKFRLFWMIVLACGILFTIIWGKSPTQTITVAQAANGFLLPVTAILLVIACNDKKLLGQYKNKLYHNILAVLVIGLAIFIGFKNLYTLF